MELQFQPSRLLFRFYARRSRAQDLLWLDSSLKMKLHAAETDGVSSQLIPAVPVRKTVATRRLCYDRMFTVTQVLTVRLCVILICGYDRYQCADARSRAQERER